MTPVSPIAPTYATQAATALQIRHGIAHLRTVNPAIFTILTASKSVRAVLLAGDMLLSRMGHAFIAWGEKAADFPLDLAAFYLDGRALSSGQPVEADKIRAEVRDINSEKFESDPETTRKWIEALGEAESIVAKIQAEVGRILDASKINIIQFTGRYGDKTAEELVKFIETHRGNEPMVQRSEAFILVRNLAGHNRLIAALSTSQQITLAMSMVELCRVHKTDIMNHYVQRKTASAFIESMRAKQIWEFREGLRSGGIDPRSVMPGVELTPQQAELIFGYIFDNPPLRDEDHMAKYRQIAAKLRYVIANSPNFGLTVDTRAVLCEACAAAFTQEHYRHFMDFFGYRVNFPEK